MNIFVFHHLIKREKKHQKNAMTTKCAVEKYNPSLEPVLPLLWGSASLQNASWSSKEPPSPRGGKEVGASLLAPFMVPGKSSLLPHSCCRHPDDPRDWDGSSPSTSWSQTVTVTRGQWHLGVLGTWLHSSAMARGDASLNPCCMIQFSTRLSHMGHYDLIKLRMLEKP